MARRLYFYLGIRKHFSHCRSIRSKRFYMPGMFLGVPPGARSDVPAGFQASLFQAMQGPWASSPRVVGETIMGFLILGSGFLVATGCRPTFF